MILYKYRSINSWTKDILTSKKIWLAKPDSLNDPFECRVPTLSKDDIRKHIEETMNNQVTGFIMGMPLGDGSNFLIGHGSKKGDDFFGKNEREVRILLKRIKNAKDIYKKHRIINNFRKRVGVPEFSSPKDQLVSLKDTLENLGIFSLSEDPLNMLMWSHYGYNHEGIAIGFKSDESAKLGNKEFCKPVNYEERLPSVDVTSDLMSGIAFYAGGIQPKGFVQFKDPQIQRVLFSKTEHWGYEKEWRYVEPKFGAYDLPGEVAEIIFGLKCKEEDIKLIVKLCTDNFDYKIKFRKVVNAPNGTTLQLQPLKI
ncbi:DUF2971 domain-containing protein [Vibrio vulnificus]|nr:DUF2971 domain-containing protein [Vibrio vulnificus]